MSEINDLYKTLEKMLDFAEKGKEKEVLELNKEEFEPLFNKIYGPTTEEPGLSYDRCRQGCVLGFTPMFKDKYDKCIADAKETFAKIPEPNNDN